MPISVRRSAASITKIRKISRMPAAMANVPKVENSDRKALPCSSARSRPSCFSAATSRPAPSRAGVKRLTTSSVWPAPDTSPPRFESNTCEIRPSSPTICCARPSGVSSAGPSCPAPRNETTSRTTSSTGASPANTTSRSPAVAPNSSAPSSLRKTSCGARSVSSSERPPDPVMSPNPAMLPGSDPKSVTRGSLCRDDRSCTAIGSITAGATPSTSGDPSTASRTASTACSSK
jgi:hypothetical protein